MQLCFRCNHFYVNNFLAAPYNLDAFPPTIAEWIHWHRTWRSDHGWWLKLCVMGRVFFFFALLEASSWTWRSQEIKRQSHEHSEEVCESGGQSHEWEYKYPHFKIIKWHLELIATFWTKCIIMAWHLPMGWLSCSITANHRQIALSWWGFVQAPSAHIKASDLPLDFVSVILSTSQLRISLQMNCLVWYFGKWAESKRKREREREENP